MSTTGAAAAEERAFGLCAGCVHARRIENRRGSLFLLCRRSEAQPETYPRYPALPVRQCTGFERPR